MAGADAAIARALRAADLKVVAHVPGFGASQVFGHMGAPGSYHEEAAYGVAHGCAVAGGRAAVLFKGHGMMKAANALSASLTCGVSAGLVCVVFEDPTGAHSDNIIDSRRFLRGLNFPIVDSLGVAWSVSEARKLPVAVIADADDLGSLELGTPMCEPEPYASEHLVLPFLAEYQLRRLQARLRGDSEPERPPLPRFPEDLPAAWHPTLERYRPAMEALAATGPGWVAGDTGLSSLFGLPPYQLIQVVTCMGGSVPLAVGGWLAGRRPAWAVTGDFSFLAAGHLGLVEARLRSVPVKVAIFYNGRAEATGGQPVDAELLRAVLAGWPHRWVSEGHEQAVREAAAAEGMQILVLDVTL